MFIPIVQILLDEDLVNTLTDTNCFINDLHFDGELNLLDTFCGKQRYFLDNLNLFWKFSASVIQSLRSCRSYETSAEAGPSI